MERYMLGDEVPVMLITVDENQVPTTPDAHPTVAVINSSGTTEETITLPLRLSGDLTGVFYDEITLDSKYATGTHHLLFSWAIGGTTHGSLRRFEIVGGGNTNGQAIALQTWKSPASTWLIAETDQGVIKAHRNPRVTK